MTPSQFFRHNPDQELVDEFDTSYDESTWQGALKATGVAKELMQSTSDLSDLYTTVGFKEANLVMHRCQQRVLHDLTLSAYLKNTANLNLQTNDNIPWTWVVRDCAGGPNSVALKQWENTSYVYNPCDQTFSAMLDANTPDLKTEPTDKLSSNPQNMHLLCDRFYFLYVLRLIAEARYLSLDAVVTQAANWVVAQIKEKDGAKFASVAQLQSQCSAELYQLGLLLHSLPSLEQLRTATDTVNQAQICQSLEAFFVSRPDPDNLVQKGVLLDIPAASDKTSGQEWMSNRSSCPSLLSPSQSKSSDVERA